MKIQPININNNYNYRLGITEQKPVSKPEVSLPYVNFPQKKVFNINYFGYFPNISFGKKRKTASEYNNIQEKSGDFKISQYNDITCPACGKKMMNAGKFKRITHELLSVPPDEYLEVLKKYKNYMRPVEESVFDEIYALSQKTDSKKDIRELLVSLREKKLPILQDAQMRQVKKMIALSKTLPDDEKAILQDKIKKLIKHIYKTNSEAPFRRKILLDRISKIKLRNQVKYERLQNIAKNCPTSSDINSAWIVKYSGQNKKGEDWTSFEIAQRFLSSSVANTDHILAYSINENRNDIANYMSMHSGCNSQKRDKSFLQWWYEDKDNRTEYLQTYFDEADELTKNRIQKKKYKNYVPLAAENIKQLTKGRLIIDYNRKTTNQEKMNEDV